MLDILVLLTTTFRSMGHTSQRFFNCVTWCVLMYFPTKIVGVGPYPIAKNTTAVFEHIYHDYTYHDGFRHRKKVLLQFFYYEISYKYTTITRFSRKRRSQN